jgi:hypothetical protein
MQTIDVASLGVSSIEVLLAWQTIITAHAAKEKLLNIICQQFHRFL